MKAISDREDGGTRGKRWGRNRTPKTKGGEEKVQGKSREQGCGTREWSNRVIKRDSGRRKGRAGLVYGASCPCARSPPPSGGPGRPCSPFYSASPFSESASFLSALPVLSSEYVLAPYLPSYSFLCFPRAQSFLLTAACLLVNPAFPLPPHCPALSPLPVVSPRVLFHLAPPGLFCGFFNNTAHNIISSL